MKLTLCLLGSWPSHCLRSHLSKFRDAILQKGEEGVYHKARTTSLQDRTLQVLGGAPGDLMPDCEGNSPVVGQPGSQVKIVLSESAQSIGTRHDDIKVEPLLRPGQNELDLLIKVDGGVSLRAEEPGLGKTKLFSELKCQRLTGCPPAPFCVFMSFRMLATSEKPG